MSQSSGKIKLIVNADDFGYYNSVSKGIISGGQQGVITATGIMANSPLFDDHVQWLNQIETMDLMDLGVHLNTTHGSPLTETMRHQLADFDGQFPSKYALINAIISRKISIADITNEWRAQISRCIEAGVKLQFLNSHEHIHMLPPLYKAVKSLAAEFDIPHIRYSAPEIKGRLNLAGVIRNFIFLGLNLFNRRSASEDVSRMLGMNESGNLSLDYFKAVFPAMQSGHCYELMCHPGYLDSSEIKSPELLAYHHWESELALLKSDDFKSLCQTYGVELVRYRDIDN